MAKTYAALALIAGLPALHASVLLNSVASPSSGQAGVTMITLMGSGFPSGTIPASNVSVQLKPSLSGTGPAAIATATAVQLVLGTTSRVTFQIPVSIVVPNPIGYSVSVNGVTSTGVTFSSGNTASLTINPSPRISSLSPATGNAGPALTVTIAGQYTNFVQGATLATFGSGIAVGGSPAGQAGPITVTSPISARAQIEIGIDATPGSQSVTVSTGIQQASLANAFTILPSLTTTINVDTATAPTAIATGISGFHDEYLLHGAQYNDPKYLPMVQGLNPGFIRYPGGVTSMAFDWQTAHESGVWFTQLAPKINSIARSGLSKGILLTQAKGGACFTPGTCYSDFASFVSALGAAAIVGFNGFTDNHVNTGANMVAAAQAGGVKVIEWELSNEPYLYPVLFPTASDYATAMSPYAANILSARSSAPVGVFYQGQFGYPGGNYLAWDAAMSAYSPRFWQIASTHIYPISNPNISTIDEEMTLNGVLAHGTTEYFSSYLAPAVGLNTPIFISELNSDALATLTFESYLYNGVFLAEYVSRMSAFPNVKAIAVATLFLGNTFHHGMIRAVDDFETYLQQQVFRNPSFSTNTATDPNTQFSFYYSVPGLCMQIANLAINDSNAIWSTTVNGGPTVPILGYDGRPVPAVFAQAYRGISGRRYLLITNKSGLSVPLAVEVNGVPLPGTVNVSYVSNPSDTAANTASNQTNVQVVNTTSTNPITVGPYSVTRVEW